MSGRAFLGCFSLACASRAHGASRAEDSTAEFKLAPDWYTHILYRIEVDFYPRDKPEEKAFSLKLSKKDSYTSVAERVGQELEWDPMKLRFTTFCKCVTQRLSAVSCQVMDESVRSGVAKQLLTCE